MVFRHHGWGGHIRNPSGAAPLRNITVPIPCDGSGIRWSAATDATGWGATLFVPWALVAHPFSPAEKGQREGPPTRIWRANFARFDTPRVRALLRRPWWPDSHSKGVADLRRGRRRTSRRRGRRRTAAPFTCRTALVFWCLAMTDET
jgi:hypothetical protein